MHANPIRRSAFSMAEVLFSLACVSLLFIPLYSVFMQGSYGTVQVRKEVIAQQHATNLLSYLYLYPYHHRYLEAGIKHDFGQLNLEIGIEKLSLNIEKNYSRKLSIREFTRRTGR